MLWTQCWEGCVNVLQAAGLYVPCKFSISMDTADVNFKYYPHTFWKSSGLALCWLDSVCDLCRKISITTYQNNELIVIIFCNI